MLSRLIEKLSGAAGMHAGGREGEVPRSFEDLTGLVEEMQRFWAVHRERRVPRGATDGLYEALLWCLQNFEVEEGHRSYIRSNLGPDAITSRAPLVQVVAGRIGQPIINEPRDVETARGGEIELALRSLLDILRHGKTDDHKHAASAIKKNLAALIEEFDNQRSEIGWED
jgi:hypothetical protein